MNKEQKDDLLPSASLVQNGLLCAVFTGKHDKNGIKINVGDKIKRLYTYEIRLKNDVPYAHILDGSNYHLRIEEVGCDFKVIEFSKSQAIQLMREGKKVTHQYFTNNEWMQLTTTGMYQFEDGVVCPSLLFWQDRKGQYWETGWSLYGA